MVVVALLSLGLASASCGGSQRAPQPDVPKARADGPGVVTGVVKFEGQPPGRKIIRMGMDPMCAPKHQVSLPGSARAVTLSDSPIVDADGHVANVFIYVRDGLAGAVYETPTAPVQLDQSGCQYEPHVFGVFVAQPIEIRNSDPTPHNIHALPKANSEFDFSEQPSTAPVSKTFDKPEIGVPLSCNLHRWMRAYANVVTNPFFAVTGANGAFELRGLPAGTFTIEAWHEEFGRQTQQVTISEGSPSSTVAFSFGNKAS